MPKGLGQIAEAGLISSAITIIGWIGGVGAVVVGIFISGQNKRLKITEDAVVEMRKAVKDLADNIGKCYGFTNTNFTSNRSCDLKSKPIQDSLAEQAKALRIITTVTIRIAERFKISTEEEI